MYAGRGDYPRARRLLITAEARGYNGYRARVEGRAGRAGGGGDRSAFLEDGPFARITRGAPIVTTPEEIDITSADQLRAALLHAAGRPSPAVVVDMTRTRFCDSAGLHTLIGAHRRARTEGWQVRLEVTGPRSAASSP